MMIETPQTTILAYHVVFVSEIRIKSTGKWLAYTTSINEIRSKKVYLPMFPSCPFPACGIPQSMLMPTGAVAGSGKEMPPTFWS
jgi:hypothetical protein